MKKKIIYQLAVNQHDRVADINIYGDISSHAELFEAWGMSEGEVSGRGLKTAIDGLDVDVINVYINSYGGEVAEALAIHSALRRHKAQIHTFCDGFACSAATIIFCAGDVRTMGSLALFMIHDCMSYLGYANSRELRKAADDNDIINSRSIKVYGEVSNLAEDDITEMMAKETWLTAEKCLEYGFATDIAEDDDEDDEPDQSAFGIIRDAVIASTLGDPWKEAMDAEGRALVENIADAIVSKITIPAINIVPQSDPEEEQPSALNRFVSFLA